ncbi:MAG TPA: TasA family protein [Acidimicrobiales bacterium]|nr:TasA family protein [Acidimicrobiales bacterium]
MSVVKSTARKISKQGAKKVALSAVMLAAAGGVASQGAFATFTSTATGGPQTISSGTVTIVLGATGAATNRLTVNATGLAAGDTVSRSFDLQNTGSIDLASIALTTTASPTSLLDTDATNGLQMVIKSCSVAWTESGPPYTYTCSGTSNTVVASRAVIGSGIALSGLNALTHGGTDHLEVVLTLPSATGNTFQNLTSTISYAFTGTQRNAQAD